VKKLYVGNLPWSVDGNELKEVFSAAGPVESATVITDRETGRSKGFGFVDMETDDDAQKAIDQLDGSDVGGRTLKVSFKREKPRGPRYNN
jgi:RNA recognition motif-containing protein